MAIDQQLRMALFRTLAGNPSMTVADLVILLDGGSLPMIDQQMRIALYRTLGGFPGATVADVVALSSGGGNGLSSRTWSLMLQEDPSNFWRCSENVNANGFSDCGLNPVGLVEVNTPGFANDTPMATEPLTRSTLFTAASSERGLAISAGVNTDVLGTAIVFFKGATLGNNMTIFGQSDAGGGGSFWIMQYREAVIPDRRIRIAVQKVSSANLLDVDLFFNMTSINPADGKFHMIAFRQPGDGTGINAFVDGQFFVNGGAVLSEILTGTATKDDWCNDAATAGTPAIHMAIGGFPTTVGVGFFDGELFNAALIPTVLTDDELNAIWDLALANGLNP